VNVLEIRKVIVDAEKLRVLENIKRSRTSAWELVWLYAILLLLAFDVDGGWWLPALCVLGVASNAVIFLSCLWLSREIRKAAAALEGETGCDR